MLLASGAKRIHIVDLEGSLGRPNLSIIRGLKIYVGVTIQMQLGGGLRSSKLVEAYLRAGASDVVLGTIVLNNPKFLMKACFSFQNRIGIGLDDNSGFIMTNAWKIRSQYKTITFLKLIRALGYSFLAFTSIQTDGGLEGINWGTAVSISSSLITALLVSGGLSSAEELKTAILNCDWMVGIMCGSVLYKRLVDGRSAVKTIAFPTKRLGE
ncbi:phosphoribosylformimino-5-aminoimidazole carboxamide ribotide isomerase [Candidatus Tremblaya phenacola PAVE]|nr:phosphoribosylformimino-5-aminoimidazole carboxamide ribotide isomerase [Candidatus Tremblaya phenacola PAVE]